MDNALPNKIHITWGIEDVKSLDPKLTDAQAREVLAMFAHNHDGSMSAMWDDLSYHLGEYKSQLTDKEA